MDDEYELPSDIVVPEGRNRAGLAHQLRVDISIAIQRAPSWVKRMLSDKNDAKARGARVDLVQRVATAIEGRFRITWPAADDASENAQPVETFGPLGGETPTERLELVERP